jgi:hypothetical protein
VSGNFHAVSVHATGTGKADQYQSKGSGIERMMMAALKTMHHPVNVRVIAAFLATLARKVIETFPRDSMGAYFFDFH